MGEKKEPIPVDAYWTRLAGGGNYLYLVRPASCNDPKVYAAKPL